MSRWSRVAATARAWREDAVAVRGRASRRGAQSPSIAAALDPSLWALSLLRGAALLRAVCGSSLGLSTALRVGFHIDVWSDDIGGGLRLPHPFNIVIGGGSVIGAGCTILHGVTIEHGQARVGAGAVLATGAVILGGACVGDSSVVGALSVVRGLVPPGSVAVGAPARVVRRARMDVCEVVA